MEKLLINLDGGVALIFVAIAFVLGGFTNQNILNTLIFLCLGSGFYRLLKLIF